MASFGWSASLKVVFELQAFLMNADFRDRVEGRLPKVLAIFQLPKYEQGG